MPNTSLTTGTVTGQDPARKLRRPIILFRVFAAALLALFLNGLMPAAWAAPDTKDVPDVLKPWVPWVLHGKEEALCPSRFDNANQRLCGWPTRLELNLTDTGGTFKQRWRVFKRSWVPLVGGADRWPARVTVNDQPAVLTDRNGAPNVRLEPGLHEITGSFAWTSLPKSLRVPPAAGLIDLTINGTAEPFPDFDRNGNLWLRQRQATAKKEESRLVLRVFRQIVDDMPLRVITRIHMDVAGDQREVVLGPTLMDQAIPLSLNSPLPARLEAEGKLRIQIRPGNWVVTLISRQPGPVASLARPQAAAPWPDDEVWVFRAFNNLRLVELSGGQLIDPRQTSLPPQWHKLPAYRLKRDDTLKIGTKRRGDPNPAPDQLKLTRTLWLDFDGRGYTARDQVQGSMSAGWRLDMNQPAVLGRVSVNRKDRFITRAEDGKKMGVELRQGKINLSADSRVDSAARTINAVGWDHDFQALQVNLGLPPGWRLFHAGGADSATRTWVGQWDMWSLFHVLIIALAIAKLWNWRWGGLSVITMALVYHEVEELGWALLSVLAAVAIVRNLPDTGRLRTAVSWYRNLSLLSVVLIVLPFMVSQVRIALYPQLERPWRVATGAGWSPDISRTRARAPAALMEQRAVGGALGRKSKPSRRSRVKRKLQQSYRQSYSSSSDFSRPKVQYQYDPSARITTGPGVPGWSWTTAQLSWSGPVAKDQTLDLALIPPWLNSISRAVGAALAGVLALLMLSSIPNLRPSGLGTPRTGGPGTSGTGGTGTGGSGSGEAGPTRPKSRFPKFRLPGLGKRRSGDASGSDHGPGPAAKSIIGLLALGMAVLLTPHQAAAEFPNKQMLDQLRDRLLKKPDCFPNCAQLSALVLNADNKQMSGYLEVMAAEGTAVPLPGSPKLWRLRTVSLNGQPVPALRRDNKGTLWVYVPKGLHVVTMQGPLANEASIALSLPLRPRKVAFSGEGWRIEGLDENGVPQAQIRLTRDRDGSPVPDNKLEPTSLPSFARVERTLILGLSWSVTTRVIRDTATREAVVIKVPLLGGESVTSAKVRVKDGHVLVSMTPDQRQFAWSSTLERAEELTLTAPETTDWTESWQLDASPVWHVESQGLAPVFHQDRSSGTWRPKWRPWPGEKLTLKVSRPAGVEGRTFTIDKSEVTANPGERATDMTLTLQLRSSQGQQYDLRLPKDIKLTEVKIDRKTQPIRARDGVITLPISPGRHEVVVKWQEKRAIKMSFNTSRLDLGASSVNSTVSLSVPRNRWVLGTSGPTLGPAVLFWGVLAVIVAIAFVLHRVPLTPLRWYHWLLLGVGLTQTDSYMAIMIALWLLALGGRGRMTESVGKWPFNLVQIGLAILTLVAVGGLFAAVQEGLLGRPDMQVSGNGSTAYSLNWYQDRADGALPTAGVISVSIWYYKILMLLWALWLAFALLRWAKWGWGCYSADGLWQSFSLMPPPRPPRRPAGGGSDNGGPSGNSPPGGSSSAEETPTEETPPETPDEPPPKADPAESAADDKPATSKRRSRKKKDKDDTTE